MNKIKKFLKRIKKKLTNNRIEGIGDTPILHLNQQNNLLKLKRIVNNCHSFQNQVVKEYQEYLGLEQ